MKPFKNRKLPPVAKGIGRRIMYARLQKGMTRADLEKASGYSSSALCSIEIYNKTPVRIKELAQALDVSLDWLMHGEVTDSQIDEAKAKACRKICSMESYKKTPARIKSLARAFDVSVDLLMDGDQPEKLPAKRKERDTDNIRWAFNVENGRDEWAAPGVIIKKKRLERGLSASDLGTLVGCSETTVKRVEDGKNSPFIKKIADELDILLLDKGGMNFLN